MRAATSPTPGRPPIEKRFQRIEWLRAALTAAAWPLVRLLPRARLFPLLHRLSRGVSRVAVWSGFRAAHGLDPNLRGVVLRELVRACRMHLGEPPIVCSVENEETIRRWLAQGQGVMWCGLHHGLCGLPLYLFELWDVPAASVAINRVNPAWGGCRRTLVFPRGSHALVGLRRALERGSAAMAILDQGGSPGAGYARVQTNMIELARRAGAPVVVFRGEIEDKPPRIRLLTRLLPASALDEDSYWRGVGEAFDELYARDRGVSLRWEGRQSHRMQSAPPRP